MFPGFLRPLKRALGVRHAVLILLSVCGVSVYSACTYTPPPPPPNPCAGVSCGCSGCSWGYSGSGSQNGPSSCCGSCGGCSGQACSSLYGSAYGGTYPNCYLLPYAPRNTGAPALSGTAAIGQSLSVSTGSWDANPGVSSYGYQWQRSGTNISGATGSSYTITNGDYNTTLSACVTAYNSQGSTTACSGSSATVPGISPTLSLGSISGTLSVNSTLSANITASSGVPNPSFSYQWQRCTASSGGSCTNVGSNSSSYSLQEADSGNFMQVVVTSSNAAGSASQTSARTGQVLRAPTLSGPIGAPTGTVRVGSTLSSQVGSWTANPSVNSYSYQWLRCDTSSGTGCVNIAGATSSSYTLVADDSTKFIRVQVWASNGVAPTGTGLSALTAEVLRAPVLSGSLSVPTGTQKTGSILTAQTGSWVGNPASFTYAYQWQRCDAVGVGCMGISGATNSSYTLTNADQGKFIRVQVTATNSAGSTTENSASSVAITDGVPPVLTLEQAPGQADPARTAPILFQLSANENLDPATITSGDFAITNGTWDSVSPASSASSYTISVIPSGQGEVSIAPRSPPLGTDFSVSDTSGNAQIVVAGGVDRSVVYDSVAPTLTLQQAPGQSDPASSTPVRFRLSSDETLRVSSVSSSDFEFTGGSFAGRSPDSNSNSYDLSASPSSTGAVCVALAAGFGVEDLAGNTQNTAGGSDRCIHYGPPSLDTAPALSGTARVGETLSVSQGSWQGGPAAIDYVYQWQRCDGNGDGCQDISGATSTTYTLTDTDTGKRIRARVEASNAVGSNSFTTDPVARVLRAPLNTSLPAVTGISAVGEALGSSSGDWLAEPQATLTYQWERCLGEDCQDISGATNSNYLPQAADIGSELRIRVRAENSEGSQTVRSARTSQIGKRPTNDSLPTISGNLLEGSTLSGNTGDWSGLPALDISVQWERCVSSVDNCSDISGATTLSYTAGEGDVGKKLRLRVRATNTYGDVSAWSVLSEVVRGVPVNTAAPSISGSMQSGTTLQSDRGVWRAFPAPSFAYQWQRCQDDECSDVPGATSETYTLGDDDAGKKIRLKVTASNVEGSQAALSAQTSIALGPPRLVAAPSLVGIPRAGDTLGSSAGTWAGYPVPSLAYQWLLCQGETCEEISGATASTYVPLASQAGKKLRLRITASNSEGSLEAFTDKSDFIRSVPVNFVLPSVEGRLAEGELLEALPGSWHAYPEISDFTYLWQVCSGGSCQDIPGALTSDFNPRAEDVGKTLRVRVTAENLDGSTSIWSLETDPIAGVPQNLALPSISGNASVGNNLQASAGSWRAQPSPDLSYQWERCEGNSCQDITDATGLQYTPVAADSGKQLRIRVRAENSEGSLVRRSALTDTVTEAPQNITLPQISGSTRVGATLATSLGTWRSSPVATYEIQWQRCDQNGSSCINLTGQTEETYTLVQADEAQRIRATVRATNSVGNALSSSSASARISAPPRPLLAPTITGTLAVSGTLVASPGSWGGYPAPDLFYQWQRCDEETGPCSDIPQASEANYILRREDEAHYMRVLVRATNDLGQAEEVSSRSTVVLPDSRTAPSNSVLPSISGSAQTGATLQADSGVWSAFPIASYSYRWQVSAGDGAWSNIPDAGEASYVVGNKYTGQLLRVRVRAQNDMGVAYAASAATSQIQSAPINIAAPDVSGRAVPGENLQASSGRWRSFPEPSYSYQWQSSEDGVQWNNISGASSATYGVTEADRGKLVRVRVEASNSVDGGVTGEVYSRTIGISDLEVLREDPFRYALIFEDVHSVSGLAVNDLQTTGGNGFAPGGQSYSPLGNCSTALPVGLLDTQLIAPQTETLVDMNCTGDFGSFAPRIRANAVVDEAGNSGPVAARTGEEVIVDRQRPTVEWSGVPSSPTSEKPFTYYISFEDEYPVSGLQDSSSPNNSFSNVADPQSSPIGDLQPLENCVFSVPAEYRGAYTINPGQKLPLTVDCPGEVGTFQPGIAAGAVLDQAGNSLAAASGPMIEVDQLGPSVSWTSSPETPRLDTSFSYQFQISDHSSVFNLDAEDFDFAGNLPNIGECRITNELPGESSGGDTITLNVACPRPESGEYNLRPILRANSFEDFSGNTGPSADVLGPEIVFDYEAPVGGSLVVNSQAASEEGTTSSTGSDTFPLLRTDYTDPSGPVENVVSLEKAPFVDGACSSSWTELVFQDQSPQVVSESSCYKYSLRGTDSLGNTASIFTVVRVDLTPPEVGLVVDNPTGNTYIQEKDVYYAARDGRSGTFRVRSNASEEETLISKVLFPLITDMSGGGEDFLPPFQSTYTWSGPSPSAFGSQSVRVFNSLDQFGEGAFNLIRDTEDPAAAWVDSQNSEANACTSEIPPVDVDGQLWYRTDVVCSWRVSDATSGIKGSVVQLSENNDWTNVGTTLQSETASEKRGTATFSGEGSNLLMRLQGEDNVGLQSAWVDKSVRIDRSAPVDTSTIGEAYFDNFRLMGLSENGQDYPGILKFSGDGANIADTLSGVNPSATRCWFKTPKTPGTGTEYTNFPQGCASLLTETLDVRYQIFDRAGNSKLSKWHRVNIQSSDISLTSTSIAGGDWATDDYISLQATLSPVSAGSPTPLGIDYITVDSVEYEPAADGSPITTDEHLPDMLDGDTVWKADCNGTLQCSVPEKHLYSEGERTLTFRAWSEADALGRRQVSELPTSNQMAGGIIDVRLDSTEPRFQTAAGLDDGMSALVRRSVSGGPWSGWKPSAIWRNNSSTDNYVAIQAPVRDPNILLDFPGTDSDTWQKGSGSIKSTLHRCNYENASCRNWTTANWTAINSQNSVANVGNLPFGDFSGEVCSAGMNASGENTSGEIDCAFGVDSDWPDGLWLVAGQLQDRVGNETILPDRKGVLMPSRNNPNYLKGITRGGAGNPWCAID